MTSDFFATLVLTFKLAGLTSFLLFVMSIPISFYLAFSKTRFCTFLTAIISLPLVLPPTVLGFYLLLLYGKIFEWTGFRLAFSFSGILVGSIIFNLPFMINPIIAALQNLPKSLSEASYSLGKSRLQTLFSVLLPNIKPSLFTAVALTFAHTIGEFGVVMLVGGNIQGVSRLASVAIYDEVQGMNFQQANEYALILVVLSLSILILIHSINKKYQWRM